MNGATSFMQMRVTAAGFVEMRQRRLELCGQTPVGANTIHSFHIRMSRRRGDS
uniref:Uncharacterized protein n=1 Tax=Cucumis melo TaxID=3656 RepID=A0A9I9ELP5_CUCME